MSRAVRYRQEIREVRTEDVIWGRVKRRRNSGKKGIQKMAEVGRMKKLIVRKHVKKMWLPGKIKKLI